MPPQNHNHNQPPEVPQRETQQPTLLTSAEWIKTFVNYGFAAMALSGVLYFVGYKMVLPTQEANIVLMTSVANNNSAIVSLIKDINESQKNQVAALEEFRREAISNQKESLANQRRILDNLPTAK